MLTLSFCRKSSRSALSISSIEQSSRLGCLNCIRTSLFFFLNDPPPTEIYPLSLPDALPILPLEQRSRRLPGAGHAEYDGAVHARRTRRISAAEPLPSTLSTDRSGSGITAPSPIRNERSEEHTSELQSPCNLVCRLLLEKKKN